MVEIVEIILVVKFYLYFVRRIDKSNNYVCGGLRVKMDYRIYTVAHNHLIP